MPHSSIHSWHNRLAIVTGATGAIGGAVAVLLAERGATLLATGRDQERLARLALDITDGQGKCLTVVADLATEEGLARLAGVANEQVANTGARLGALVHAQGLFVGGRTSETDLIDLDRQWQVNARSPFALTQRLLPELERARGQVVFVNSTSGIRALGGASAYAASKFALRAIADSLRHEVNAAGIRVLSIFPGRTASRMQEEVCRFNGQEYDPKWFLDPFDVARAIVGALDQPASVEVTEIVIRPSTKMPG